MGYQAIIGQVSGFTSTILICRLSACVKRAPEYSNWCGCGILGNSIAVSAADKNWMAVCSRVRGIFSLNGLVFRTCGSRVLVKGAMSVISGVFRVYSTLVTFPGCGVFSHNLEK